MGKVLFSLTYYTPYVSGLTIYVRRMAYGLSQKGVDVTVLTSQYDKSLLLHPDSRVASSLHIIRVPFLFKISKGFIMPSYIVESYKAVKSSDVVFVNLPQAEGFIVALWAKILHKKLCAIYHCDLVMPAGIINFLINRGVLFCNFITLQLADKIIVYTKEYAESSPYLRNYKSKFIQIFPPVYPLPVDRKYLQELEEKYGGGDFKLGFAARIAEEKGLEYLISAINNVNNARLFIAGPKEEVAGEKEYLKKINKFLHDKEDKIILLGNLNESQMGAFYKFIDLLVISSANRTEGFGLVQAEAMFAGKPVVATDLPGVKFLVENTGAGEIAQIKNSEDLRKKIEKVKNNYVNYQEKTKNIFKIINLELTLKQYEQLIQV